MNSTYQDILEQIIESGTLELTNEYGEINRTELENCIYYEAHFEVGLSPESSLEAVAYAFEHTNWVRR